MGAKILRQLKAVSGVNDFDVYGYGGPWMQEEGMQQPVDFDIDHFFSKDFYTYKKSRNNSENQAYTKWSPLNWINMHYKRRGDQILDTFMEHELPKKIYQARPSIILSIDNEYTTLKMMDSLNEHYQHTAVDRPQRHFYHRFIRDLKQWNLKQLDFVHFTVPT